jgi:hypothetical protein
MADPVDIDKVSTRSSILFAASHHHVYTRGGGAPHTALRRRTLSLLVSAIWFGSRVAAEEEEQQAAVLSYEIGRPVAAEPACAISVCFSFACSSLRRLDSDVRTSQPWYA